MSEVFIRIDALLKHMGLSEGAVVNKVTADLFSKIIILDLDDKDTTNDLSRLQVTRL